MEQEASMSPSNANKVRLEVRTQDVASEIFVIDGQFNLAARGIGTSEEFLLDPGIYTVKVRTGSQSLEEHVILPPGQKKPVLKKFSMINFPSPVPLKNTGQTHDAQTEAAYLESRKVHVKAGSGSSIFIFVRDWQPADTDRKSSLTPQPQRGLVLRDMQGETIADLSTASAGENGNRAAPWAACNVKVNPGMYRLGLDLDEGRIEQTVVASSGWQTQIFLLQHNYGPQAEARYADLNNCAILLSRRGFNPASAELRLVELSRLGLTNSRQVLSNTVINEILNGKFKNPMLGIYGAYLLLERTQSPESSPTKDATLKSAVGPDLLRIVVQNLRRLLGEGRHPDVEALALLLEERESSYIFEMPPMLRRSWWKIIEATVQRPELVPADSLSAQIAEHLWGEDPWLLWMTRAAQESPAKKRDIAQAEAEPEPSDLEIILRNHLRPREGTRADAPPKQRTRSISFEAMPERAPQTSEDDALHSKGGSIQTLGTHMEAEMIPVVDTSFNVSFSNEEVEPEAFDESKVKRLVQTLGVPRSTLEKRLREYYPATATEEE
jgi:hypothetical protein